MTRLAMVGLVSLAVACTVDGEGVGSMSSTTASEVVATQAISAPAPETRASGLDLRCDDAQVYSPVWIECEARSYSLLRLGVEESLTNPGLLRASVAQGTEQTSSFLSTILDNPSRLNTLLSPSALAMLPVMGDPFRHPDSPGPNGRVFYEQEAVVLPVLFHDRSCTRIAGRVWRPKQLKQGQTLPAVVINNGSVIGTQVMYFWAAQALVRAGYMVMTFDHRSQGQSDAISPSGQVGANLEPSVYWLNLIDAIDFLRSSPQRPNPYTAECGVSADVQPFNPMHSELDLERLGVAGHSFGAAGAAFAQSYGAPGTPPWPGRLDLDNPIKAIVAWDALGTPQSPIHAHGGALFRGLGNLAGPTYTLTGRSYPAIVPRVPALDMPSDFGALSVPHLLGESPEYFMAAFRLWTGQGVDSMVVVPHASTHTQYSQNPFLPASSWCGDPSEQACNTGWVIPMATHYTVAWFDRWLKRTQEPGYQDADNRLLDNGHPLTGAVNMSWHYRSARHLHDRQGFLHRCENLRREC